MVSFLGAETKFRATDRSVGKNIFPGNLKAECFRVLARVPNAHDLNHVLPFIDSIEDKMPRLMQNAPIARSASHLRATIRHLLEREDRVDQLQPKPLRCHRVLPREEGDHLLKVKISP